MANKLIAILFGIIFVGCVVGSFFFGRASVKDTTIVSTKIERDTIIVRDTIREHFPREVSSKHIRTENAYLRLALGMPLIMLRDTVTEVDSVLVEVPIEEREYKGDEYYVVIGGYDPYLKSIEVYPRTAYINSTESVNKRKHWGMSLGVQGGYGFTPKGWQPYAGVGVSFGYNF
jgi:hypothetical protein